MFTFSKLFSILLFAMELLKEGIRPNVYDYGQPRAGDRAFAEFSKSKLGEYWRTTHDKYMVPHVPPIEGYVYYHSCGEFFEDSTGALTSCSLINCEDPNCAAQYPLYQTNTDDHSYYLGHKLSCEDST